MEYYLRIRSWVLLLATMITLMNCKDESLSLVDPETIITFNVFDISNEAKSSDLWLYLVLKDFSNVQSLEVVASKNIIDIDIVTNEEPVSTGIINITPTSNEVSIRIPESFSLINGEKIISDTEYFFYVIVKNKEGSVSAFGPAIALLNDVGSYLGKYVGMWIDDDPNFTPTDEGNGSVSFVFDEFDGVTYGGQFYFTSGFNTICPLTPKLKNDGTLKFNVKGSTIEGYQFILNSALTACAKGQYEICDSDPYVGSGQIINEISFLINFTFKDCSGSHKGSVTMIRTQ